MQVQNKIKNKNLFIPYEWKIKRENTKVEETEQKIGS